MVAAVNLKFLVPGYLLSGLTFLVFTLTVFYDIPQLNFGIFFLRESDEELPSDDFDPEKLTQPILEDSKKAREAQYFQKFNSMVENWENKNRSKC